MKSVFFRAVACSAAVWVAWKFFGPFGIVFAAPLFGVAFARPLIDAVASTYGLLRARAFKDVDGRHYAYRGFPINVALDARGYKWLRLSDIRKVLPALPGDESLQQILGAGVQQVSPDPSLRIRAETLVNYLSRTIDRDKGKFSQWVAQMIVKPAQRVRQGKDSSLRQPD
jgi:hypothetical protein